MPRQLDGAYHDRNHRILLPQFRVSLSMAKGHSADLDAILGGVSYMPHTPGSLPLMRWPASNELRAHEELYATALALCPKAEVSSAVLPSEAMG